MKGKFIVIDGIDGAGTTTQVQLLANYLFEKNKDYSILLTREPTNSKYGKQIRELLKRKGDPKKYAEEFLDLYSKDGIYHVKNIIEPNVDKGLIVISDRYCKYSAPAYQGAQGISHERITDLHKDLPAPDLTIILDLPVEIALSRIHKDKELFEKKEFLELVRENYLKQINQLGGDSSKPIFLVEGSESIDIVKQNIIYHVENNLKI